MGSDCSSLPWSRAGEGMEVCVCLPPDPQCSLSWERLAVTEEGEKIEGNTLICYPNSCRLKETGEGEAGRQ